MIFLAFANDATNPLPTLTKEDDEVNRLLSVRHARKHFDLHRDSHCTREKINEYLIRYKDELTVFLYSGHAERDRLLLEGESVNSEGIAAQLGRCPKLKLVVLNGCSTAGQMQALLELPNRPVVVGTSAPVNDQAATQFSISFFQSLSEQQSTVKQAFEAGLAAAKTVSGNPLRVVESRGVGFMDEPEEGVWLLDVHPGYEHLYDWKLPAVPIMAEVGDVQPNEFFLRELPERLKEQDPWAGEEEPEPAGGRRSRRRTRPKNVHRNLILKSLPLPISEQIQKLIARERENEHTFYDKFSFDRLKQILLTYDTAVELPAFFLLAQLFDLLAEKQQAVTVQPEQAAIIKEYLTTPQDKRLRQLYFPLLETIQAVLTQNQVELFVPELASVSKDDADLLNATTALELKKERLEEMRSLDQAAITRECVEAEELLTGILKKLSFLAAYSLVSVRNIDVLRNRCYRTPSFLHLFVFLAKEDITGPEEEDAQLDVFLDNESVLLMKKRELVRRQKGEQRLSGKPSFLNLTPFVIDENAYVKEANEIKLHYFHHLQEGDQSYFFKHTYKPEDPLLQVLEYPLDEEEENNILDVWDQFTQFQELIKKAAS